LFSGEPRLKLLGWVLQDHRGAWEFQRSPRDGKEITGLLRGLGFLVIHLVAVLMIA
jgi:hypothetical protein